MGRPSTFTPELGDLICTRLMDGESLRAICRDEGMPDRGTVVRWMLADADFAARCARAREEQADLMDDRVLDTTDKVESGELPPDAARVIISALQWRAAKLKPKRYGDRQTLEHEGSVGTYVLRAPEPAKDASEWLKSSGRPSPDPRPTS